MLNIELTECGLDEILRDINNNLKSVLGRKNSKKQKDDAICKTIGAVNALYQMIMITEVDADTENESDT